MLVSISIKDPKDINYWGLIFEKNTSEAWIRWNVHLCLFYNRNAKTADVGAVAAVDDEEIPSDSDGEMAAEANPRPPVRLGKRKLTLGEYPVALKKHHQAFTSYR
ncbi:hypothetical protein DPMN_008548 [Dreissena polymorpha]|uniref:Uncharacterized protein n=1 Tax=Dreissena polymorpha TaxID=45954 RepID=A0A9D4RZ95_DREPO|nr:hypothetical protein DPMN_008548 [Dreissena polymorpha]